MDPTASPLNAPQEWKRPHRDFSVVLITVFVVLIHVSILLALPKIEKERRQENRTKVFVTTIQLSPKKVEMLLDPPSSVKEGGERREEKAAIIQPKQEPIPIPEAPKIEPAAPKEKPPAPSVEKEITPKVEVESKAPPKPKIEEPKKSAPAPISKPAVEKKTQAPPKPKTAAPVKSKPVKQEPPKEDAKKKKEQEQAKIDLEKKQLQEAQLQRERELKLQREKEVEAKKEIARQKLANIKQSSENLQANALAAADLTIPNVVSSLQIDGIPVTASGLIASDTSYQGKIKFRLEQNLRLPERGEVEIKLTLNKSGKLVKFETAGSHNSKNRLYLEQKLPTIIFPEFDASLEGESQHLFTIQLKAQ